MSEKALREHDFEEAYSRSRLGVFTKDAKYWVYYPTAPEGLAMVGADQGHWRLKEFDTLEDFEVFIIGAVSLNRTPNRGRVKPRLVGLVRKAR